MTGRGKRRIAFLCAVSIFAGTLCYFSETASAKRYTLKINEVSKKKVTLKKGAKKTVRIVRPMMIKGVTWKVKNKKIASVKKTGKYKAVITGKKKGKTKITAKLKVDPRVSGKYVRTITVTVKEKKRTIPSVSGTAVTAEKTAS